MMYSQKSFTQKKATLYLVATPIGNLSDITFRAIEVLKDVSVIFAEDTRVTRKITHHFDIETPMESYQGYLEQEKAQRVLKRLEAGEDVALVSDAGTPLISDPGTYLVETVYQAGFHVVSIPGATALISALIVSGLSTQPFIFLGFLPRKQGELDKVLKHYQMYQETVIIYESPKRIEKTLLAIKDSWGNRRIALARELSKKFETISRGLIEDVLMHPIEIKGEYVLVIEGYHQEHVLPKDMVEQVNHYIKTGHTEKDALKLTAKDFNVHKSEVYKKYKLDK